MEHKLSAIFCKKKTGKDQISSFSSTLFLSERNVPITFSPFLGIFHPIFFPIQNMHFLELEFFPSHFVQLNCDNNAGIRSDLSIFFPHTKHVLP